MLFLKSKLVMLKHREGKGNENMRKMNAFIIVLNVTGNDLGKT
jgi:hypothetical protein